MKTASKASTFAQSAALQARVRRTWEDHPQDAKPERNFTLRLNDWELELLRAVTHAEYPRISAQSMAKGILIAGLLAKAEGPK